MENPDQLGQHLMTDEKVLEKITKLAKIKKTEVVLEIGAGSGNLTRYLVKKAKKVYAVEIDEKFEADLMKLKEENKNLELTFKNILQLNFPKIDKIVANIPFSISEPLLMKLVETDFELALLTVSEHFAGLLEEKKTRLAILSNAFFNIKTLLKIPRNAFNPLPNTDAILIEIKPKKKLSRADKIIQELWRQRDKKLKNALRETLIRLKIAKTKKLAIKKIEKLNPDKEVLEKEIQISSSRDFSNLASKLG